MAKEKRPIDQVDEPEEQSEMSRSAPYLAALRSILPDLAPDHPLFSQRAEDAFRGHFALSTPGLVQNNAANNAAPNTPGLVRPSDAERQRAIDEHLADGGLINSTHAMRGVGRWEWLDDYDQLRASAMGIDSLQAVAARWVQGTLGLAQGPRAEPSVVWYTEHSYLNPRRQPAGPGQFEFQTEEAAELAAINFGGSDEHNLPPRPSATDIWQLRGRLLAARPRREDLTRDLNIVWVPENSDATTTPNTAGTTPTAPATKPKRKYTLRRTIPDADEDEPQPATYDPTNGTPGGINDQTSTQDKARYYAKLVNDKWVCMDRSIAEVGVREPHLMRGYGKKGWRTWNHAKNPPGIKVFDWNDKDHIEKLNKWRYQIGGRGDFERLRPEHRDLYTLEECKWLHAEREALNKEGRRHPVDDFHDMAERFNAKFGANRNHKAMRTKYGRVMEDFDKNGVVTGPVLCNKRPKAKKPSLIKLVLKKSSASDDGKAAESMLNIVRAVVATNASSEEADEAGDESELDENTGAEPEEATEVTGEVTEVTERMEGADEETAISISSGEVSSGEEVAEAARIIHRMSGGKSAEE